MGLVAAARIAELAVNELLEDEMPPRMVGEVGVAEHDLEVGDVTVQVAGDEYLLAIRELEGVTAPAGRGPHEREGLAEVSQNTVGRGQFELLVAGPKAGPANPPTIVNFGSEKTSKQNRDDRVLAIGVDPANPPVVCCLGFGIPGRRIFAKPSPL